MWMEHDKIGEVKKKLYEQVDNLEGMGFQDFVRQLEEDSAALVEMLSSRFYKENNILFPTALKVMEKDEWIEKRRQSDELGYCCFTPESSTMAFEKVKISAPESKKEGPIPFETGSLSREEIEAVFSTLPVDMTFVDRDDTVRYFSQTEDRIFVRTKAVIGRKVQQGHPQRSIHVVNEILEAFKNGSRDAAEFWILKGRLVHILYLPIRNRNGEYLGVLEVTQDITNLKKVEGEKRLLDWR